MKPMRHIYDLVCKLALPMVLGCLAVSCFDDDYACPEGMPGFDANDNVWVALKVNSLPAIGAGSGQSRAGSLTDDAQGHPEEEARPEENYIAPTDLTLVLFDSNGRTMRTITSDEFALAPIGDNHAQYKLVTKINRGWLNFAQGSMSVLAVANTRGINRGDLAPTGYERVGFQTTLAALTGELRTFGYDGLASAGDPATAWQPDIDAGRHIPMAGFSKGITLVAAELDNATTPEAAFDLGTIDMQRSMAKIRILDGVRMQTDLSSHTEIIKVEMRNGNNRGATVPDVNQAGVGSWANGTATIEAATGPSATGEWLGGSLTCPSFLAPNVTATDKDGVEQSFTTYELYLPELHVKKQQADQAEALPGLGITIRNANGLKEYNLPLRDLVDDADIVRNHIYQYYITASEIGAELTLHVADWEQATTEWDYSENPGLSEGGQIAWQPGTYKNLDADNARLYVSDEATAATCSFTIDTPRNATWRAVLVPVTGPQDAFGFMDDAGNLVESVSGIVTGEQVTLHVKPRYTKDLSENYSARLQILVTTPDNRTMNVDVLGGKYGANKFFTIIQNQQI